ncbi:riboflavin biosynthesis protein RibF [Chryseomicrobium palamuruense]|uniref:Riboflavin biosynthesis protein n=1 Tax=Chryseomicrobium palamuruense TaxID=682973 RepID=A0ABV8UTJ2_9BACL
MKVHDIQYPTQMPSHCDQGYSLAIGFFDGLHRGHQQLIQEAVSQAKRSKTRAAVMTFDPHPSVVLSGKKTDIHYITPLKQKLELLRDMDVDDVFVVRFTSDFARLSPETFMDEFILKLNVHHVIAGFDFSFGAFGKGDMEHMTSYLAGQVQVMTIPKFTLEEDKVSSTRIRKELTEGNVDNVRDLLGRPFQLDGIVVHGDKRGRTIQFPTANIATDEEQYIPANGVYAVRMFVQNKWVDGVCNVGYKPTVQDIKKLSIEVHLFDFDHDIYGEQVRVLWYAPIRKEQKFPSLDALKQQIQRDKEQAIALLGSLSLPERP